MPLLLTCPSCSKQLRVQDALAGKKVKCPACATVLTVPAAVAAPPPAAPKQAVSSAGRKPAAPPPARSAAASSRRSRDDEDEPDRPYQKDAAADKKPVSGVGIGLGIASLVLGILTAVTSLVCICVGWLAIPLGVIGLILGVVGAIVPLAQGRRGIGLPIAGAIVSLLATTFAIVAPIVLVGVMGNAAAEKARKEMERQQQEQQADLTGPWADASREAAELDPQQVRVRVTTVAVEGDEFQKYLKIGLKLENRGTAPVTYHSWGTIDAMMHGGEPKLTDDRGADYWRNPHLGEAKKGEVKQAVLQPGTAVEDMLYFHPPAQDINYLRLKLPGEHLGGTGPLRIQIPASMIKRPEPDAPVGPRDRPPRDRDDKPPERR